MLIACATVLTNPPDFNLAEELVKSGVDAVMVELLQVHMPDSSTRLPPL